MASFCLQNTFSINLLKVETYKPTYSNFDASSSRNMFYEAVSLKIHMANENGNMKYEIVSDIS